MREGVTESAEAPPALTPTVSTRSYARRAGRVLIHRASRHAHHCSASFPSVARRGDARNQPHVHTSTITNTHTNTHTQTHKRTPTRVGCDAGLINGGGGIPHRKESEATTRKGGSGHGLDKCASAQHDRQHSKAHSSRATREGETNSESPDVATAHPADTHARTRTGKRGDTRAQTTTEKEDKGGGRREQRRLDEGAPQAQDGLQRRARSSNSRRRTHARICTHTQACSPFPRPRPTPPKPSRRLREGGCGWNGAREGRHPHWCVGALGRWRGSKVEGRGGRGSTEPTRFR